MSRTNAYLISSAELMSMTEAHRVKNAVAHTVEHRAEMEQILFNALTKIEHCACKHGVSQFEGYTTKQVEHRLHRLSRVAYKRYLQMVKDGGTLRQQRAFVRAFTLGRNLRVIRAASQELRG